VAGVTGGATVGGAVVAVGNAVSVGGGDVAVSAGAGVSDGGNGVGLGKGKGVAVGTEVAVTGEAGSRVASTMGVRVGKEGRARVPADVTVVGRAAGPPGRQPAKSNPSAASASKAGKRRLLGMERQGTPCVCLKGPPPANHISRESESS
jgi:hypothetical protein